METQCHMSSAAGVNWVVHKGNAWLVVLEDGGGLRLYQASLLQKAAQVEGLTRGLTECVKLGLSGGQGNGRLGLALPTDGGAIHHEDVARDAACRDRVAAPRSVGVAHQGVDCRRAAVGQAKGAGALEVAQQVLGGLQMLVGRLAHVPAELIDRHGNVRASAAGEVQKCTGNGAVPAGLLRAEQLLGVSIGSVGVKGR
ncbi:MAG: hypothetical protein ACK5QX_10330 [bacterium]